VQKALIKNASFLTYIKRIAIKTTKDKA